MERLLVDMKMVNTKELKLFIFFNALISTESIKIFHIGSIVTAICIAVTLL